ncbi:MAG: HAD-IIB family hydrolase [Gammaproteobacteria bacterium]|nr:HAD-IIB family hydrolase [Gammaproteobacteria bacterium]
MLLATDTPGAPAAPNRQLLIFSDLDGTLLDHHDYSYTAAEPAIEELRVRAIPLILNTSKTLEETRTIRAQMGNNHPFIVENGGAVAVPEGYFEGKPCNADTPLEIHHFGLPYGELCDLLQELRAEHQWPFRGFRDFSVEELSRQTGLTPAQAKAAKARESSEPVKWAGEAAQLKLFESQLSDHGLKLVEGGRFHHVMGRTDKGRGLQWLLCRYRQFWPETEFVTVALGDGGNDVAMLEVAQIPVVITPSVPERAAITIENSANAHYPSAAGPTGWAQAIQQIINQECLAA